MIFTTDNLAGEVKRMCFNITCNECPLGGKSPSICRFLKNDSELNTVFTGIAQWSREHKQKTNLDKFREVFGENIVFPPESYSSFWSKPFKGDNEDGMEG